MVQYRCLGTRRPGAAVTSPIFMTRAWHAASATPERAALWRKSVAHPQPKGHRVKIRRQLMASMAAVLVTAGLGFAVIHHNQLDESRTDVEAGRHACASEKTHFGGPTSFVRGRP